MKKVFIFSTLLLLLASQLICSSPASAKTTVTEKHFSVGFMLDDDTCDFDENYEMPDEINTLFTLKKIVRTSRKGQETTYQVYRSSARFPLRTSLSTVKPKNRRNLGRGFTASGSGSFGSKAFKEKITILVDKEGIGTATLAMTIVDAGSRCQYVYSGDAMRI